MDEMNPKSPELRGKRKRNTPKQGRDGKKRKPNPQKKKTPQQTKLKRSSRLKKRKEGPKEDPIDLTNDDDDKPVFEKLKSPKKKRNSKAPKKLELSTDEEEQKEINPPKRSLLQMFRFDGDMITERKKFAKKEEDTDPNYLGHVLSKKGGIWQDKAIMETLFGPNPFEAILPDYKSDFPDPPESLAPAKSQTHNLVGLKNFSATCYLNTFMQTLYHLVPFRDAIYKCPASEKEEEDEVLKILQDFFVHLELGKLKTYSPDHMVNKLKINREIQQDPSELYTLVFQALFGEEMKRKKNVDFLMGMFTTKWTSTLHIHCAHNHKRPSKKELDNSISLTMDKNCTLADAISRWGMSESKSPDFRCEKCGGDEKYAYANCYTNIQFAPVVLFRLDRLAYDPNTYQRIKKKYTIEFNEEEDLNQFASSDYISGHVSSCHRDAKAREDGKVAKCCKEKYIFEGVNYCQRCGKKLEFEEDQASDHTYRLHSIILHKGSNASYGHYICEIKVNNEWYKFDDETIKKIKQPTLKSSDAYALVYVRSDLSFQGDTQQQISQSLREMMQGKSEEYRENCERYMKLVAKGKELIETRKKAVEEMIKAAKEHKDDEDWVIVKKQALRRFITGEKDNSPAVNADQKQEEPDAPNPDEKMEADSEDDLEDKPEGIAEQKAEETEEMQIEETESTSKLIENEKQLESHFGTFSIKDFRHGLDCNHGKLDPGMRTEMKRIPRKAWECLNIEGDPWLPNDMCQICAERTQKADEELKDWIDLNAELGHAINNAERISPGEEAKLDPNKKYLIFAAKEMTRFKSTRIDPNFAQKAEQIRASEAAEEIDPNREVKCQHGGVKVFKTKKSLRFLDAEIFAKARDNPWFQHWTFIDRQPSCPQCMNVAGEKKNKKQEKLKQRKIFRDHVTGDSLDHEFPDLSRNPTRKTKQYSAEEVWYLVNEDWAVQAHDYWQMKQVPNIPVMNCDSEIIKCQDHGKMMYQPYPVNLRGKEHGMPTGLVRKMDQRSFEGLQMLYNDDFFEGTGACLGNCAKIIITRNPKDKIEELGPEYTQWNGVTVRYADPSNGFCEICGPAQSAKNAEDRQKFQNENVTLRVLPNLLPQGARQVRSRRRKKNYLVQASYDDDLQTVLKKAYASASDIADKPPGHWDFYTCQLALPDNKPRSLSDTLEECGLSMSGQMELYIISNSEKDPDWSLVFDSNQVSGRSGDSGGFAGSILVGRIEPWESSDWDWGDWGDKEDEKEDYDWTNWEGEDKPGAGGESSSFITFDSTVTFQGTNRRFYIGLPTGHDATGDNLYPVLVYFHGGGSSVAEGQAYLSTTQSQNIILAVAEGANSVWDGGACCTPASMSTDPIYADIAFFENIASEVAQHYNGDPDRVYIYGLSNGGVLTTRIACESSVPAKVVDYIGALSNKQFFDEHPGNIKNVHSGYCSSGSAAFDQSVCPYETWANMDDYYPCDNYDTNKPDMLRMHGRTDTIFPYQTTFHM